MDGRHGSKICIPCGTLVIGMAGAKTIVEGWCQTNEGGVTILGRKKTLIIGVRNCDVYAHFVVREMNTSQQASSNYVEVANLHSSLCTASSRRIKYGNPNRRQDTLQYVSVRVCASVCVRMWFRVQEPSVLAESVTMVEEFEQIIAIVKHTSRTNVH